MAALGQWLVSVTAAALLWSVMSALLPEGTVKPVGLLGCSLLLLLTVVRPVAGLRWEALERRAEAMQRELERSQQTLETQCEAMYRQVIDLQGQAYSRDITAGLDVTMEIVWDWSSQPPVPAQVRVIGAVSEEERWTLAQRLAAELGLAAEQIVFTEEGP